ncbi:MAG: hypothetical protein LBP59_08260 [Planctomycetaceae bacterium]|nr:hypothetical protein [Planctomycetaceae bacterium]
MQARRPRSWDAGVPPANLLTIFCNKKSLSNFLKNYSLPLPLPLLPTPYPLPPTPYTLLPTP